MKRGTNNDKVTVRNRRTAAISVTTANRPIKETGNSCNFSLLSSGVSLRSNTIKKGESHLTEVVSERKRLGTSETNVSIRQNLAEKRQKTMGNISAKEKMERRKANRFAFGRHGDFNSAKEDYIAQKAFNAMEERCNCTLEQLEATEMELGELRQALQDFAKKNRELHTKIEEDQKTIENLNSELDSYRAEHVKAVNWTSKSASTSENKENFPAHSKEVCFQLQRLEEENKKLVVDNGSLRQQVKKLEEEVEEALHANEDLNAGIESERTEWESLKADLLVAVKVANDFKVEAQKEKQALLAKIVELQGRRLSSASLTTLQSAKRSPSVLTSPQTHMWEDVAWDKLSKEPTSGKNPTRFNGLLQWCRSTLENHSDVDVTNFSSSWADGKALCYLLATFFPQRFDLKKVDMLSSVERLQLAFEVGRDIGIKKQIAVDDIVNNERPPWALLMSYILNIYYIVRCL